MNYGIYGPFELPRHKARHFTHEASARREFWHDLDAEYPGLPDACGCYLISVRSRVWYVGMAQRQSYRYECFTADKILKIERAMDGGGGSAYITLIARHTSSGRFSKPSINGYFDIQDLELLLIGSALERNADLLNRSATKVLREIVVPGFLNSPLGAGKRTSVRAFQRIMGI
ncbi:MAG: hypothetical protein IPL39_13445 [Opitutaceae bacterium]|nr:hypothetical protein [Opitutaceae bacterium]